MKSSITSGAERSFLGVPRVIWEGRSTSTGSQRGLRWLLTRTPAWTSPGPLSAAATDPAWPPVLVGCTGSRALPGASPSREHPPSPSPSRGGCSCGAKQSSSSWHRVWKDSGVDSTSKSLMQTSTCMVLGRRAGASAHTFTARRVSLATHSNPESRRCPAHVGRRGSSCGAGPRRRWGCWRAGEGSCGAAATYKSTSVAVTEVRVLDAHVGHSAGELAAAFACGVNAVGAEPLAVEVVGAAPVAAASGWLPLTVSTSTCTSTFPAVTTPAAHLRGGDSPPRASAAPDAAHPPPPPPSSGAPLLFELREGSGAELGAWSRKAWRAHTATRVALREESGQGAGESCESLLLI
mmetsp:Transcript_4906/g.9207  ORF Transcript_4906/g.9207 Transcript_4906/m.9207 type:complete len:350 (+) Transcript_4906:1890-2939(+)